MTYLSRLARFTAVMAALVAVIAGSLALIGPQVAKLVSAHRSDHEQITLEPLAERSYLYDAAGNLQGTMTDSDDPQNRTKVTLDQIPATVRDSVIAAEDANFYHHTGINVRSILRAVDANLESGEVSQGGSTITQQVVKNSLVGNEQDLSRKLREAFLAVELEKQMSKDEILEYYLNSVYFGGGAYGVQAASEYYFDKDVGDLNWSEGALLAALIRSPNYYNPFKNPDVARERRSIVFKRLVTTGKLTQAEADFSEGIALPTVPHKPAPPYDYFVEEVKQQLLDDPRFGLGATEEARYRAVFTGGIKVFTTLDPALQATAIQARNETLPKNKGDATFDITDPRTGQLTFGTEAMATVEPSSGAVRAMVGGPGFEKWQFNLATERDPGRQPGSTMKTFVLATLFEEGYVPSDTLPSTGSCSFKFPGSREISTYTGRGGTITSMTQASSNCGFMRLGQVAGIPEVAALANSVGIKSQLNLLDQDGNPIVTVSERSQHKYDQWKKVGFNHVPWVDPGIYERIQIPLDIGLCPLLTNVQTLGKSDVKFLEYTINGAATIAQNNAVYNRTIIHGETGLLVGSPSEMITMCLVMASRTPLRPFMPMTSEGSKSGMSPGVIRSMARSIVPRPAPMGRRVKSQASCPSQWSMPA